MKTFVFGSVISGLTICTIALVATALGLGHPNCEPTTAGYIEFFVTLFSCGVGAFVGSGFVIGTLVYISNKFA